jgi:hypothetical protein
MTDDRLCDDDESLMMMMMMMMMMLLNTTNFFPHLASVTRACVAASSSPHCTVPRLIIARCRCFRIQKEAVPLLPPEAQTQMSPKISAVVARNGFLLSSLLGRKQDSYYLFEEGETTETQNYSYLQ